MNPVTDALTGLPSKLTLDGADTGDPETFSTWEQFWQAYVKQTRQIIKLSVATYEKSETIRARFFQTPYLSCLVKGCASSGKDINQGGPELNFVNRRGRHLRHNGGFAAGGQISDL